MSNRTRRRSPTQPSNLASVVRLQDYKAARHAAFVLEGLLHEPPWLLDVRPRVAGGEVRLVVRLRYPTPQARVCTPTRVNSIPVHVEEGN